MSQFDYIIVGAGSAGCVLAHRLSADPSTRVLLLEAGGSDRNPMYKVPKFLFFTGQSKTHAWHYPVEPFGPAGQVEDWVRGKVLEIGPGNGATTKFIMQHLAPAQLVGIDPSPVFLDMARATFAEQAGPST